MPDYNICLLGFSPESETRIKKIISSTSSIPQVSWVAANHKGLNGVVINANFLSTPQIQKYISLVKCPLVCAYNSDEGAAQVKSHHFPSLDLRDADGDKSASWLSNLLGEANAPSIPLMEQEKSAKNTTSLNQTPSYTSVSSTNTQELLDHISKRDNVVIRATFEKSTTWIKPRDGLVFINYPRESVPGFDSWAWVITDNNDIPDNVRKLQFDLWLFETLWQSDMDSRKYVDDYGYYRLIRFPQPLGRHGRTEALRLATCAQSHPVNIETLFEKTSYSHDRIRRFLFATLMAGQVQKVERDSVIADEQVKRTFTPQEKEKVEQKRSLLQRLREKLGL
ncbi:MAG: hypothetical protein Q4A74_05820 [Cardiobacteriaceae bacterium]|nr:hypothetical protein [Cardiobacteriaceae bacterium]